MNKYKLLSICAISISIILAVVIAVQAWLYTPIRFKGATEDMYILRGDGFTLQMAHKLNDGSRYDGFPYERTSKQISIIDEAKIYSFLANLEPLEEKPLTNLESDSDCFIDIVAPYVEAEGHFRTGVHIMSCGGRYLRVNRVWHASAFEPIQHGESWYYDVGEKELVDFIDSVIAIARKNLPKDEE